MSGWHLKKEVTIGQIVTIMTLGVSLTIWAINLESKVDKHYATLKAEDIRIEQKTEIITSGMNDRFDRFQATVATALRDIQNGINRVEDKLDKKADK